MQTQPPNNQKSTHAEREERILAFWKEKGIFQKSLDKKAPKGEFVFFEGPPTANGRPGIHHLEARSFKDAIPRYKTMRGYHVRRKGGWDTHGLPVELQVEKELGLKSKKEIESYGVAAFNEKCKDSVWTYVREWEDFTKRMGYWIDLKNPYVTYKPQFIESVWNVIKTVDDQGLLYKDYKVVPWCPRCGTALSSHELAQGYADVKDLSVTVAFQVKGKQNTFILAWTTTPWTLPGNVGLAVNPKIDYVEIELTVEGRPLSKNYILAKARLAEVFKQQQYRYVREIKGSELVGLEYETLYPFLGDHLSDHEKPKLKNAFKVYPADFVTTADGTGIVHTSVMYGQEDFELGTKVGLPKHHLVHEDGTFKKEAGFLAGKFVKDEETAVDIIKDLAGRGLLFAKEKYEHSYPFCWRCKTPLIYFARDSWYIRMSSLREKLVKENEGIHWEPEHTKEGRFGEWLREVKDWAISRERYWGTPLPVWTCHKCHAKKVVGSIADIEVKPRNQFFAVRHGQSENNVAGVFNSDTSKVYHLTDLGKEQAKDAAKNIGKNKIDVVFTSPFARTRETAETIADQIGYPKDKIMVDDRLHEMRFGGYEGKTLDEYVQFFKGKPRESMFSVAPEGAETRQQVKDRAGSFLKEMDAKYEGKNILVVSHEGVIWMMMSAAKALDVKETLETKPSGIEYIKNGEVHQFPYRGVPRNSHYELDLHKPFIDEVKLSCSCGETMVRAKEVMDVWFDSGSMPFAQDHYPFEAKKGLLGFGSRQKIAYPADFISEAIDQTRGWFYTLHAIGVLMGKGKAFKNVICLGHILDGEGKKMSKSLGNIVNPWDMMDKYGADALRYWMYSVNQPGESKNFEEKTVDEVIKKVFNLVANVATFYKTYADAGVIASDSSTNVLDRWIVSRLNELTLNVTMNMDRYIFMEPTRAIREFIADLSQWYLRRSRDRFKEEGVDKVAALATTKHVLLTVAKLFAPFAPFFAEELYQDMNGPLESVHLESWPESGKIDKKLNADMDLVRKLSSLGLEARMKAKANVRQPLASFSTTAPVLTAELTELVKDEINVKEIKFGAAENSLDVNLTPELKEEGDLREFLRKVQDMRKEKGLTVQDQAVLVATSDLKDFINRHLDEIKRATRLSSIEFGEVLSLKSL